MRVKKLLALLLSGAFFAGCLSGCDRTIIEHQFHTNTEYIEIGGADFNLSFTKLENFLASKSLDLVLNAVVMDMPLSFDDPEEMDEAKKPLKEKIQSLFDFDNAFIPTIICLKSFQYELNNFYIELSDFCDEFYNYISDTNIVTQDMWNKMADKKVHHVELNVYNIIDEETGESYMYYKIYAVVQ